MKEQGLLGTVDMRKLPLPGLGQSRSSRWRERRRGSFLYHQCGWWSLSEGDTFLVMDTEAPLTGCCRESSCTLRANRHIFKSPSTKNEWF